MPSRNTSWKAPRRSAARSGGVELLDRAPGEDGDHVVERRRALDGAVGELGRERAVAGVEARAARLGVQRPVGPGVLLEDAAQDRVGDGSGGADRGGAGRTLSWGPDRLAERLAVG